MPIETERVEIVPERMEIVTDRMGTIFEPEEVEARLCRIDESPLS